jgi:beta-glucanase (GH16 family)
MARKITLLILFSFSAVLALHASAPKGYRLVWADEFNTNRIDTTSWSLQTGDNGWGNRELQYYTPAGNAEVTRGSLVITARREGNKYTSARMVTRAKRVFTYGYFEMKAKLPKGTGTWPALWMLGQNIKEVGWPACGELDIMEHVGKNPGQVHCSIHNPSGHGETPYTGIIRLPDLFNTYHLYAMEWTPEHISFLVDGKLVYNYAPKEKNTANWPFDKPMYLIFNVAIGGNWGGPVVDDSCLPQSMTIDYVRVYQRK